MMKFFPTLLVVTIVSVAVNAPVTMGMLGTGTTSLNTCLLQGNTLIKAGVEYHNGNLNPLAIETYSASQYKSGWTLRPAINIEGTETHSGSCGGLSSCILSDSPSDPSFRRKILCYGENHYGALGHGGVGSQYPSYGRAYDYYVTGTRMADLPETDPGPEGVEPAVVATTYYTNLALLVDGTVKVWGAHFFRLVGVIHFVAGSIYNVPALIFGGPEKQRPVIQLATGTHSACALHYGGGIRCWGYNAQGQLGLDSLEEAGYATSLSPLSGGVALSDLQPIGFSDTVPATYVSVGAFVACAIFENGKVRCWGKGMYGENGLGRGDTGGAGTGQPGDLRMSEVPYIPFSTTEKVVGLDVSLTGCAIFSPSGSLRCWGRGDYGQLGRDSTAHYGGQVTDMSKLGPITFGTTHKVIEVQTAYFHIAAVFSNNRVRFWGAGTGRNFGTVVRSFVGHGGGANSITTAAFDTFPGADQVDTYRISPSKIITRGNGTVQLRAPYARLESLTHVRIADPADPTNYGDSVFHMANLIRGDFLVPVLDFKGQPYIRADILLSEDNGSTFSDSGVDLVLHLPPNITHVHPNTARVAGTYWDITIYGHNFQAMSTPGICVFSMERESDGLYAEERRVGTMTRGTAGEPDKVQCASTAPSPHGVPGLGAVRILISHTFSVITEKAGEESDGFPFQWVEWDIVSVTPRYIPLSGGTIITITGPRVYIEPTFYHMNFYVSKYILTSPQPTAAAVQSSQISNSSFIGLSPNLNGLFDSVDGWQLPSEVQISVSFANEYQHGTKGPVNPSGVMYFAPAPLLLTPQSVPVDANATVMMFGYNLHPLLNPEMRARLTIGGIFSANDTVIYAAPGSVSGAIRLPVGPVPEPGVFEIVATNDGQLWSAAFSKIFSRYQHSELVPRSGPTGGKTKIYVHGLGFLLTSAMVCSFVPYPPSTSPTVIMDLTFVSTNLVICESPAWTAGPETVAFEISIDGGIFTENRAHNFSFYNAPTFESVGPTSGSAAPQGAGPLVLGTSANVTITGAGFVDTGEALCGFGTDNSKAFVLNNNTITCQVPRGTGTQQVRVALNGVDFDDTGSTFTFISVFSVLPPRGVKVGGTLLEINGDGLPVTSPLIRCRVGGVIVPVLPGGTPGRVQCRTPPRAGTTVDAFGQAVVEITGDGVYFSLAPTLFAYYATDPQVTSITPAFSHAAGGGSITVYGNAFPALPLSPSVLLGLVDSPALSHTPSSMIAAIPSGTGTAVVEVTHNGGADYSTSVPTHRIFYFSMVEVQPRAIPASASAGAMVTIKGSDFPNSPLALCRFGNDTSAPVAAATRVSSIEVVCLTPTFSAGTDTTIQVNYAADGLSYPSDEFSVPLKVFPAPRVLSVAPSRGPPLGITVTVTGTGFTNTSGTFSPKCSFGGVVVEAVYGASPGTLLCDPPVATGSVPVEISLNGGAAFTDDRIPFTFFDLFSIDPREGFETGGTDILVTGTGFVNVPTLSCRLGTAVVTAVFETATRLRCVAPPLPSAGSPYTVTLSVDAVHYTVPTPLAPVVFTTFAQPTISLVAPLQVPSSTASVTIFGTNFPLVQGGAVAPMCSVGTALTPAISWSGLGSAGAGTLVCTVPPGSSTVAVGASFNGGADTTADTVTIERFSVFTVSPSLGPASRTSPVIVSGSGFSVTAPSPMCRFGATLVPAVVTSSIEITCSAPALPPGGVPYEYSDDGIVFSNSLLVFTYYLQPNVTAVSPSVGPGLGTVATLYGSDFVVHPGGVVGCVFANTFVPATALVSASELTCTVPGGSGTVPVTVSLNGGADRSGPTVQFTYFNIFSITPPLGPTDGATPVFLSGSGFVLTATTRCRFGTIDVAGEYVSSAQVRCISPPNPATGTVFVEVSLDGSVYSVDATAPYTYYEPPSLTAITPDSGPSGGILVTLYGSKIVQFTGAQIQCRFGVQIAYPVAPVTAVVVAGVITNTTYVVCEAPQGAGIVAVDLSVNGGYSYTESGVTFSYFSVDRVEPPSGPAAGGTEVLVTGAGFVTNPAAQCRFGNLRVPATVVSTSQVRCVAPELNPGPVAVEFSSDSVLVTSAGNALYTYYKTPHVVGAYPPSATGDGGTLITVYGSDFINATLSGAKCRFGSKDSPVLSFTTGRLTSRHTVSEVVLANAVFGGGGGGGAGSTATTGAGGTSDPMYPYGDTVYTGVVCMSPSGTAEITVEVSFNGGSDYTSDEVRILYFSMLSLAPTLSPAAGGGVVVVSGAGYRPAAFETYTQGGATVAGEGTAECRFGDVVTAAVYKNDVSLECSAPPLAPGQYRVAVSMDSVNYAASKANLTVFADPVITGLFPTHAPALDGQRSWITVQGANFPNVTGTLLAGAWCTFGTTKSAGFELRSPSELLCRAPAQNGESVVSVTFNDAVNTHSGGLKISYFSVVTIEPTTGPLTGSGTTLTVRGTGFTNKSPAFVRCIFGGRAGVVATAKFISTEELQCDVPPFDASLMEYASAAAGRRASKHSMRARAWSRGEGVSGGVDHSFDRSFNGSHDRRHNAILGATVRGANDLSPAASMPFEDPRALLDDATVFSRHFGGGGDVVAEHDSHARLATRQTTVDAGRRVVVVGATVNGQVYALPISGAAFTYYRAPVVTAMVPRSGHTSGAVSNLLTLHGSNFLTDAGLQCRFDVNAGAGGYRAATVINSTVAICRPDVHATGNVTVDLSYNTYLAHPVTVSPYEYTLCVPGTVSPSIDVPCEPCSKGFYSPTLGGKKCVRCPATMYAVSEGQAECESCPDNTHIPDGLRTNRTSCGCKVGYFQPDGIAGEACVECLPGAECAGDFAPPVARAGYWADADNPRIFLACDTYEACPGGPPTSCRGGYTGRLCAVCEPGRYALRGRCEPCPVHGRWRLAMFVIFCFGLIGVVIKSVGKNASSSGGVIGISTFFFQVLSMLTKLDLSFPPSLRFSLEIVTMPFTFDMDALASECAFPVSYEKKWFAMWFTPFTFVGGFIIWYVALAIFVTVFNRRRTVEVTNYLRDERAVEDAPSTEYDIRNRCINAYFLLITLIYLLPITKSFEIFDCTVREDGKSTLDAAPGLLCYEPWWYKVLPFAAAGTVFYAVLLPAAFALIVRRNRHRLDEPRFISRYGSIFVDFKPAVPYWEAVIMLQKVALLIPIIFFTGYREFQVSAFLLFVFLGLTVQLVVRPFFLERYNRLQTVLRWCSCLMLLIGMAMRANFDFNKDSDSIWNDEQAALLGIAFILLAVGVTAIIGTIVFDITVIHWELRRRLDRSLLVNIDRLCHPHGKTELIQWLGRGSLGQEYEVAIRRIFNSISLDWRIARDRDLEAGGDGSNTAGSGGELPIDHFVSLYCGRIFLRPVVPVVRDWILRRVRTSSVTAATVELAQFEEVVSQFARFQRHLRSSSSFFVRPERGVSRESALAYTAFLSEPGGPEALRKHTRFVGALSPADVLRPSVLAAVARQLHRGEVRGLQLLIDAGVAAAVPERKARLLEESSAVNGFQGAITKRKRKKRKKGSSCKGNSGGGGGRGGHEEKEETMSSPAETETVADDGGGSGPDEGVISPRGVGGGDPIVDGDVSKPPALRKADDDDGDAADDDNAAADADDDGVAFEHPRGGGGNARKYRGGDGGSSSSGGSDGTDDDDDDLTALQAANAWRFGDSVAVSLPANNDDLAFFLHELYEGALSESIINLIATGVTAGLTPSPSMAAAGSMAAGTDGGIGGGEGVPMLHPLSPFRSIHDLFVQVRDDREQRFAHGYRDVYTRFDPRVHTADEAELVDFDNPAIELEDLGGDASDDFGGGDWNDREEDELFSPRDRGDRDHRQQGRDPNAGAGGWSMLDAIGRVFGLSQASSGSERRDDRRRGGGGGGADRSATGPDGATRQLGPASFTGAIFPDAGPTSAVRVRKRMIRPSEPDASAHDLIFGVYADDDAARLETLATNAARAGNTGAGGDANATSNGAGGKKKKKRSSFRDGGLAAAESVTPAAPVIPKRRKKKTKTADEAGVSAGAAYVAAVIAAKPSKAKLAQEKRDAEEKAQAEAKANAKANAKAKKAGGSGNGKDKDKVAPASAAAGASASGDAPKKKKRRRSGKGKGKGSG